MFRIWILISIVISLLFVTGCSALAGGGSAEKTIHGIPNVILHNPPNTANEKAPFTPFAVAINAAEMANDPSRGIGFRRPGEPDRYPLETSQNAEFRIEKDEPLMLYLLIPNGDQGSRTLLVTAVLDYQQVSFEMDGQEGLLHAVTVPTNTHTNLLLKLKTPGEGAYDFQIICFDDPFNKTLDRDYRMNLRGYVSARRAVIIVGNNETPVSSLHPNITGNLKPPEVTFDYTVYFASAVNPDKTHPSYRQLYAGQASAGKPYPFQIVLNNEEDRPAAYAIIPFLDYHQIAINGQKVLCWQSQPAEEAIIDTHFDMPQESGVHQLQMVYLYDPYKSILRKEVFSTVVFGSPRLAIEAR